MPYFHSKLPFTYYSILIKLKIIDSSAKSDFEAKKTAE